MTNDRYRLRPGAPSEVPLAAAIDDTALGIYSAAGITIDFDDDHPLVVAEQASWTRCAEAGGLFFAVDDASDQAVGFVALGEKDRCAYLEQIAVRPSHMRRGIGGQLMEHTFAWSRERGFRSLLLTTYDHVAWNRPYYERFGFTVASEAAWGPQIAPVMALQRAYLPAPDKRIVMRKVL